MKHKHFYTQSFRSKSWTRLCSMFILAAVSFLAPQFLYRTTHRPAHIAPPATTLSQRLQEQATHSLQAGIHATDARRGCVVVLDAQTGAIKAMVSLAGRNYATHADNMVTSAAWEPGSVMKPLTIATALNEDVISIRDTTFYDSGETYVDGYRMTNALPNDPRTITIQDIINQSINTGTINVLRQLGGGEINARARQIDYDYLTRHYRFGQPTGIDLPDEAVGYVASPTIGNKLNIQYANMAFGQGITVTPLQFISAYAAVLNGGTYYQPHLTPRPAKVLQTNVVTPTTSNTVRQLLQTAFETNSKSSTRTGFQLGGKTGTAHVATATGEYVTTNRDNGTYIGYVSRGSTTYVMLVRLDEPKTETFASAEARSVWLDIMTNMIDRSGNLTAE